MHPFSTPWKGVEKGCIGSKWVKGFVKNLSRWWTFYGENSSQLYVLHNLLFWDYLEALWIEEQLF